MRLIKRAIEILINQGVRKFCESIKMYFLWHPVLDEASWYCSKLFRSRYQICGVILGHKMLVDITSGGIQKQLYLHGIHEPESTKIFSQIIPENARVVDIGANIGYYALIEAKRAQKVYAIEPEPNNIEILRKNIALNNYENVVEVYQYAISDGRGTASLDISNVPNKYRLQSPLNLHQHKLIEVETITLDEFLGNMDVDVVRMDLEGAEWLVINGMKNLIGKGKPLILFIEIHRELITDYGGDALKLLDFLFESGFKIPYLGVIKPRAFSLKNCMKSYGIPEEQLFRLNPPANINNLDIDLGQFLDKHIDCHIFLIRS